MDRFLFLLLPLALTLGALASDDRPGLKVESFDRDPAWEGVNNRVRPTKASRVTQDFGFSAKTSFASKNKGEIGGKVWRSSTPAHYGERLDKKTTLDDKLSASGSFALTASGSARCTEAAAS